MPVCGSDQMERLPFSVYGRSPLVAHWLHSKSLAGKSQHTTGPNTMIRVQVEKLKWVISQTSVYARGAAPLRGWETGEARSLITSHPFASILSNVLWKILLSFELKNNFNRFEYFFDIFILN